VYGIVRKNQGFVSIYSEPGKGTTVKVYLHRHAGEGEGDIHEIETEVPLGRGETILLVEDEASVPGLARRILETLGYEVMTSMSPEEAIEMVREHVGEIHLLITDVVLPEMNGKDLALTIRKMRPGIRTLYMSGYTANVIAHHGVLDNGVRFVEKPFTPQTLGRKVREAMGTGNAASGP